MPGLLDYRSDPRAPYMPPSPDRPTSLLGMAADAASSAYSDWGGLLGPGLVEQEAGRQADYQRALAAGVPREQALRQYGADLRGLAFATAIDTGGILAGPRAIGANLEKLAAAKGLEAAGHDAQHIWEQTGWFRSPDDNWKYEIPDAGAHLYSSDLERLQSAGQLPAGKVLRHQALYEAYPFLENLRVTTNPGGSAGLGSNLGVYRPGDPAVGSGSEIGLDVTRRRPEVQSTMLHELQHAVQRSEGFARGGSPWPVHPQDEATRARFADGARVLELAREEAKLAPDAPWSSLTQDQLKEALQNGRDRFDLHEGRPAKPPPWLDEVFLRDPDGAHADVLANHAEIEQRVRDYPKLVDASYEQYRRIMGEAEARAVQERAPYSPAERTNVPGFQPMGGYDVPWDELVRAENIGPPSLPPGLLGPMGR